MEHIPKRKSQALKTYLNNARASGSGKIRRRKAAKESGLDEATVQTILSELNSEGILDAKLEIRCPYCNTQHGIYSSKGSVPADSKICFNCENEFLLNKERNWEVIYEIANDIGDFFQNDISHIKKYIDEVQDLSSNFFVQELDKFYSMDNPQKRGRDFDYFMGLLFQQLPGVEVRPKVQGNTGEVDMHLICLDAPDWLYRLVGSHTLVENKWEKKPIQKNEVSNFYSKASEIHSCEMAYFVSMSGFSRGERKQTGALANLKNYQNPRIIDFWDDDVEEMVEQGTPEEILRSRMMK